MTGQTPEATKRYREKNRERINTYLRKYGSSDLGKENRRNYRRAKPEKQLLYSARSRAKRRGILFDLKESDIVIPDMCPILGIPLFIMDGKPGSNSPTLDQIIPGEGYIKSNVCVISHKANTMKQNNTIEDFERFIRYMKGEL